MIEFDISEKKPSSKTSFMTIKVMMMNKIVFLILIEENEDDEDHEKGTCNYLQLLAATCLSRSPHIAGLVAVDRRGWATGEMRCV